MCNLVGLTLALVPAPPSLLFSSVLRVPDLSTSGLETLCRPVWGRSAASAPWFHSRPQASPFSSTPHPTARRRPNWDLNLSSSSACDLWPSSTPAALGPLPHWTCLSVLPNTGGLCLFWQVLRGQPQPGGSWKPPEVGVSWEKLGAPYPNLRPCFCHPSAGPVEAQGMWRVCLILFFQKPATPNVSSSCSP